MSSKFEKIHEGGDYGSEFEYDSEAEKKRKRRYDLATKTKKKSSVPSKRVAEDELDKEEAKVRRFHMLSMSAFARHKKMVNDYLLYYQGKKSDFKRDTSKDKTDLDVIRENHQFLWDEDETDTWEKQLAKKYYDKLFKEYSIADLSRYKENQIALRWRTEKEVMDGKGQFSCGNKKCSESEGLRSWEINFGYIENGEKKNALVKIRLCPDCSYKLNYKTKKREVTKNLVKERSAKKAKTSDSEKTEADSSEAATPSKTETQSTESSMWEGPVKVDVEKSREDEFEEFLEDLFL